MTSMAPVFVPNLVFLLKTAEGKTFIAPDQEKTLNAMLKYLLGFGMEDLK